MKAYPVASYTPELIETAQAVGCKLPEPGFEYRVLYQTIRKHEWNSEANTTIFDDAKNWAAELLMTVDFIIATAVVNGDGNVMWNLTKDQYAAWFHEQARRLETLKI